MTETLSYRTRSRKLTPAQREAKITFGKMVAKARMAHNYSLGDIAHMLRVTRQGAWEWEHGCMPSDEKLAALAQLLNLDYNELLALKEKR